MQRILAASLAALVLAAPQTLAAADPSAAPPPGRCPDEALASRLFSAFLGGNRAGYYLECRMPDGSGLYVFEFNDRGRGPLVRSRIVRDAAGIPTALTVDGHDYLKNAIAERFALTAGRAAWTNKVEKGERALQVPAFYLSQSGTPAELPMLVKALLDAPSRTLALLPSGEARVEALDARTVRHDGQERRLALYAVFGLGYQPTTVWLDDEAEFFASVDSWFAIVPEGWEAVVPELLAAQDEKLAALRREQAKRLRQAPAGPILIENANLFDAESRAMKPGSSVLVEGAVIRAVGPDGSLAAPRDATRIDARGRALVPGLWDMHGHPEPADGLLLLAGGVTGVRDMAAEPDKPGRMKAWEGDTLGPRIAYAGIVDGPGPFQGPTKVLAGDEAAARAAVDAMADAGFVLVKVYSSVKPELVPAIVDQAAKRGLRVGGHIPAGMTAERAVRAGYDEIQHMNMVFLNFMFDLAPDTRTPARLTVPAEHAADLDFGDAKTKDFIALLAKDRVTVDPTLQLFENLILDRAGEVATAYRPIADRLPPVVRRGLLEGGLPVTAELEPRYRASFRAMLRMVTELHAAGVPIVAGTDSLGGFALIRELELYVQAGIPAPEVLQMATLGAARAAGQGERLGSIAPGKLADFILVDGDPSADPGALRSLRLVVKNGVPLDPVAMWRELGIAPLGD
jgi:imidazolonepropionase-like amidohydrolase